MKTVHFSFEPQLSADEETELREVLRILNLKASPLTYSPYGGVGSTALALTLPASWKVISEMRALFERISPRKYVGIYFDRSDLKD